MSFGPNVLKETVVIPADPELQKSFLSVTLLGQNSEIVEQSLKLLKECAASMGLSVTDDIDEERLSVLQTLGHLGAYPEAKAIALYNPDGGAISTKNIVDFTSAVSDRFMELVREKSMKGYQYEGRVQTGDGKDRFRGCGFLRPDNTEIQENNFITLYPKGLEIYQPLKDVIEDEQKAVSASCHIKFLLG